jgi:hypothetical protein
VVSALASVRRLLPFLTRLTAHPYALFLLPFLEGHSFGVSYQTHRQERTEKHIKCQTKTRPPARHTGVVDEEAMDVIKNAVPNKGSDD